MPHEMLKTAVRAAYGEDAVELYPEDYDFSILFDTVENRKKRHEMQRKYTDDVIEYES